MLSCLNNTSLKSRLFCASTKRACFWLLFFASMPVTVIANSDADTPYQKTREELFLDIFKNPTPNIPVNSYILVLFNDGMEQKMKVVMPQGKQEMLLEGKLLIKILSQQLLNEDALQQLEHKIDAEGWLNINAFKGTGVSTSFNPSKFELTVTTLPSIRKKKVSHLSAPIFVPSKAHSIPPAPISGFINFEHKVLVGRTKRANPSSYQPQTGISASGAINVMGVVVETSVSSQTSKVNSLQRGDIRLVYDQPHRALRYTLGDLKYPTIGYQRTLEVGGIGVAKDFSLQPYVPNHREKNLEFYLEQPSTVDVWVNESLVSSLELPAGRHDIRGFSPALGQNDTRLVIENASGQEKVMHYSYVFNSKVLSKGKSQFFYNAGFSRTFEDGIYHYDSNKPVLSASYRMGIADQTNLIIYAQTDYLQSLIGTSALHTLPTSTLQVDIAASQSVSGKQASVAKISWNNIPKKNDRFKKTSQLSMEYLGKNFGLTDTSSKTQRDVINLNATVALQIGSRLSVSMSGAFAPSRDVGSADSHRGSAGLSYKWGKAVWINSAIRRNRSSNSLMQTEILFGISSTFSNNLGDFYVAKEIESNSLVSTWNSRSGNTYKYGSARVGSDKREYRTGVGYHGSQGLAELSHFSTRTTNQDINGSLGSDDTVLLLQTALVLANSTIALARPVKNGFAIIKGNKGLSGIEMMVDPIGGGGMNAKSNWLSPAVLVDIPNYQLQKMNIEPVNPTLGVTPKKMNFSLFSAYKSGFLIEVGKERTIFAIGRLVDKQQAPLANTPIQIRHIKDADNLDEKVVHTVTSQSGRFQMSEIKPGYYEITTELGSVTVEVVESDQGISRLGDLVVQH
jgi:outer membrane usher protein